MPIPAWVNGVVDTTKNSQAAGAAEGKAQLAAMDPVVSASATTAAYTVDGYIPTDHVEGATRVVDIYPSVARTATPTAPKLYAYDAFGITVVINVTAKTNNPSVVPTIDGYDPISNTWYNLLTGAAIVNTGQVVLRIAPGIAAVNNLAVNSSLPDAVRVVMTHGNTDSMTYSVGVQWDAPVG